jgi:hypothetical protein
MRTADATRIGLLDDRGSDRIGVITIPFILLQKSVQDTNPFATA